MPTVIIINGYRFFFYSNEGNEPIHIHIEKADGVAKVWLVPVRVDYFHGFTSRQQKEIIDLTNQNKELFIKKWNEYFS